MKIDEIKLLYDYNDWADARILAACARVTPEQYAAPTLCGTGWGGLRPTMVHMLDSIWQSRIALQGFYNEPLADEAAYDATELHEDAFPTLAALRERAIPVAVSMARIFRPSRPIMRPFISSLGNATVVVIRLPGCPAV